MALEFLGLEAGSYGFRDDEAPPWARFVAVGDDMAADLDEARRWAEASLARALSRPWLRGRDLGSQVDGSMIVSLHFGERQVKLADGRQFKGGDLTAILDAEDKANGIG